MLQSDLMPVNFESELFPNAFFTCPQYTCLSHFIPVFVPQVITNVRSIFFLGAIQVLRNADGVEGCEIFRKNALRRCMVQCYWHYEGVGGVQLSVKKHYVTLSYGVLTALSMVSCCSRWSFRGVVSRSFSEEPQ